MTTPHPPSMELVPGHAALGRRLRQPAVALGNFDGVHLGHAALFAETKRLAREADGEAVVLTFLPHPVRYLTPKHAPPLITAQTRKLELIAEQGMDVCVVEPFDEALAALSPEEFVDRILVAGLGARAVCVGYDFNFGRGRAGSAATLTALGAVRGFEVRVIAPVTVDGIVCSSTKIRQLVRAGEVEGAARLLGRDFELEGRIVHGAGRGRTIGVPTINLQPDNELLPGGGVYAGWAWLPSGERVSAAINVGTNPTFTGSPDGDPAARPVPTGSSTAPISIEAHLLDFSAPDLYGNHIRLGFGARLRDERRFPSVEALVAQIRTDIEAARAAMGARSNGRGETEKP